MGKIDVYGVFSKQKDDLEQQVIRENNNILNSSRIYPDGGSDILAKVVQYCFDTSTIGTFKNLDEIFNLVKRSINYSVLSTFKNVVISSSGDDVVVQYSRNDPNDMTKVNTMTITIKSDSAVQNFKNLDKRYSRNVQGISETYKMVINPNQGLYWPAYKEKAISRCRISDMNAVSFNELSEEGKELFKRMVICSSLFEPVLKKLVEKQVVNFNQSDLNDMFNKVNYDDNFETENEEDIVKGASL